MLYNRSETLDVLLTPVAGFLMQLVWLGQFGQSRLS